MLVSGQLPSGFDDFVMVAIPTWICTAMMFAFYKQEYKLSRLHDDPDQGDLKRAILERDPLEVGGGAVGGHS